VNPTTKKDDKARDIISLFFKLCKRLLLLWNIILGGMLMNKLSFDYRTSTIRDIEHAEKELFYYTC